MPSAATELVHAELERAELHTVLTSQLFVRSPILAHLLSYLCEKKFAAETDQIKEYSIAVDVFGRRDSFERTQIRLSGCRPIACASGSRNTIGARVPGHALRITIPVGQDVPTLEKPEVTEGGLPPTERAGPASGVGANKKLVWKSRAGLIFVGSVALAVLAVVGFGIRGRFKSQPAVVPSARQEQGLLELPVGLPVGDEARILAGAYRSYVDRAGKTWSADAYFSGGKPVRSPVQHIWRTQDPSIYRSSRQADFRYDIPLKAGTYELRLHFAETYYGPEEIGGGGEGSRVMMVSANGTTLLSELDVVLDAGGSRTADVKVFTGIAAGEDGSCI